MGPRRLGRVFVLIATLLLSRASAKEDDMQCQHLADAFLTTVHHRDPFPYSGENIVYFLHVPRTAGEL